MADKKYTSINRDKAAGRVEFKGGKTVWEWSEREGDSTSILLKSLDNPDLELEKTHNVPLARKPDPKSAAERTGAPAAKPAAAPKPQASKRATSRDDNNPWDVPKKDRGGGFDPYNRS